MSRLDFICGIIMLLILIPITLVEFVLITPFLIAQGIIQKDIIGRYLSWFKSRLDIY